MDGRKIQDVASRFSANYYSTSANLTQLNEVGRKGEPRPVPKWTLQSKVACRYWKMSLVNNRARWRLSPRAFAAPNPGYQPRRKRRHEDRAPRDLSSAALANRLDDEGDPAGAERPASDLAHNTPRMARALDEMVEQLPPQRAHVANSVAVEHLEVKQKAPASARWSLDAIVASRSAWP